MKTYPKDPTSTDDNYPPQITLAPGEWYPVPVNEGDWVLVYYVPGFPPTKSMLREIGLEPNKYGGSSTTFPGLSYVECEVVSK